MKLSLASVTSIIIVSSALMSGCASTPSTAGAKGCDTSQSVGSCSVVVKQQGSKLVVCPSAEASAAPVCMNAVVGLKFPGQQPKPVAVTLQPNQCVPLNSNVLSAEQVSCTAFAPKARTEAVASSAQ